VKLGLWGARADRGGLAALTYEFFRHLEPERTLVVDLGAAGRGPSHHERYPGAEINCGYNDDIAVETVRRFATGLDVVYAAETAYREDVFDIMRECGVRTVLHSMPELWRADMAQPDVMWVPTKWELSRMPDGTRIVPVPVPTDTFAGTERRYIGRWLHMGAPAFHDRNGTLTVIDALAHVTKPIEVLFTGRTRPPPIRNHHGTSVTVEWTPGSCVERRDAYPDDCQGLILPRRYAGLSLPMQEAAALGWAIAASDLPPQNEWLPPEMTAPARLKRQVRMAGGVFNVHECGPAALAAVMDRAQIDLAAKASRASLDHADQISWDRLLPVYREALDEAAA